MTMRDNGPAQALATFARNLTPDRLPPAVWLKAANHIIDAIGLAFASRSYPFAAPSLQGIRAAGSAGDATVIGDTETLAPRDAAFANALLIHGLDFDDTHPASIVHPTVACLPTAVPYAFAPVEQTHVPAVLWIPETETAKRACVTGRLQQPISHDFISQTVMGYAGVKSKVYKPEWDLLAGC